MLERGGQSAARFAELRLLSCNLPYSLLIWFGFSADAAEWKRATRIRHGGLSARSCQQTGRSKLPADKPAQRRARRWRSPSSSSDCSTPTAAATRRRCGSRRSTTTRRWAQCADRVSQRAAVVWRLAPSFGAPNAAACISRSRRSRSAPQPPRRPRPAAAGGRLDGPEAGRLGHQRAHLRRHHRGDGGFSCVLGRPIEAENILETNQPTTHSLITDHYPK